MSESKDRARILELIESRGGLRPGVATAVARETGVPEADVFGAGSFFHLLAQPEAKLRVCSGLPCQLRGGDGLLEAARQAGLKAEACSCLAACDRAPAVLRDRETLVEVSRDDMLDASGDWQALRSAACPDRDWKGVIGSGEATADALAIDLAGAEDWSGSAYLRAAELGPEAVIEELDAAGLLGRGGAGFPAAIKWRAVRGESARPRYVVLNADEGEPATFKDREILLRRPDKVLEGLAIAARALDVEDVYLYLRGEFGGPWRSLERALQTFAERETFKGIRFHLHAGHGAYICGEETALLEALEGKRGMPRIKPPFPTQVGLWGRPTLIQNVETIACVPAIVARGGVWFKGLGRTGAGTKIYSLSGHVARPGNYELPLGVSLDELVAAAGGYVGTLRAFSPGGASSGFLPASERTRPLDFESLGEVGSMLGSAGVVVLDDTVDLIAAVRRQLGFFEAESCGQCAPCRIGTRFLHEATKRFGKSRKSTGADPLEQVAEVAWEMDEGSICGLGQAAAFPLTSALKHFPEEFSRD